MKEGSSARWLPLALLALYASADFVLQYLLAGTKVASLITQPYWKEKLEFIQVRKTWGPFQFDPIPLLCPNRDQLRVGIPA